MKRMILFVVASLALFLTVSAQGVEAGGSRKTVRHSGDVVSVVLPAAGATALLLYKDGEGLKQAALAGATTLAATILLKQTVKKERPDGTDNQSFPSRHAAVAFAAATFLQQRYGWTWGAPALAAATYISWTRVYGKKHDVWDVAAGAAIGAGSSFLFTRRFTREHRLTLCPTANGIYASLQF